LYDNNVIKIGTQLIYIGKIEEIEIELMTASLFHSEM
jgi:hypothetical protein